ncbi:MAG: phasin [Xanthobacteraceae bacterium]|nr:phasin [Xanthobacteraceae bacterium]MBX3522004.1 phasin [Xanthobacteraceae bacterium]MBX3534822.1 phasin [Xanthobacteraceae bacterium]MBX3548699.1 phasin [Xanthobacteraceae bacterium]MCW5673750.1 phasin [Xanthobacteraceae bacterium]
MPKFEMPKMEVPEMVREIAEKGVKQAKEGYDKMKAAAEDTTDLLETTYTAASKGATEFNMKALEALRANVNASFDFTTAMFGTKTLAEAAEISTAHFRAQFEALSAQAKELSSLAQKIATETSEPIKTGVSKSFKFSA